MQSDPPRAPTPPQEEKSLRPKTLAIVVVSCLIAAYTSFTLLFTLALQGDQPFVSHPPKGRCDKFFTHMTKLGELSTYSDSLFGYRYDAGHSAALMCTNEPLHGIVDKMAETDPKDPDLPRVFDPWAYDALAATTVSPCNLTGWTGWADRIGPNTTVECPTPGPLSCGLPTKAPFPDPLAARPSPLVNAISTNKHAADEVYSASSGRNGPWWTYAITFGLEFENKTDCGLDVPGDVPGSTPTSIILVKNDLPVCDKRFVWAFDYNDGDLILYYKVILIAFFIPHIMYMYYAVRFWILVGTDDAHAAVFRDDGAVGFGAIVFFVVILVSKVCCCCCKKTMPSFAAFIEKYQSPDAKMFDGDCLPPKRILPFIIDLALSMVESSFTAIALWGCTSSQLGDYHRLLLGGTLTKALVVMLLTLKTRFGMHKQRDKFEKAAAEHGDLPKAGEEGNAAALIDSLSQLEEGQQMDLVSHQQPALQSGMLSSYEVPPKQQPSGSASAQPPAEIQECSA